MKEYFSVIKRVALFDGISEAEIQEMLDCLGARIKHYGKNRFMLMAGDKPESIGILLGGTAHVIKETPDGNRIIVAALKAGGYFAEALVAANVNESPVSVVAAEDAAVLLLDYRKIMNDTFGSCRFRSKLIENMLKLLARKNLHLQGRLDVIGKKTLRQKILAYLSTFPVAADGSSTIPLSREELADYLCADRSALSHELSRMQKAGEIEFRKNVFKVLNP